MRPSSQGFRESFSKTINRYPFSPGAPWPEGTLVVGDHGGLIFDSGEGFSQKMPSNLTGRICCDVQLP